MKLTVFGANGPTGRLLTQLALDEDHDVVAFTRHPGTFPIEHRRLDRRAVGTVRVPPAAPAEGAEIDRRGLRLPRRVPSHSEHEHPGVRRSASPQPLRHRVDALTAVVMFTLAAGEAATAKALDNPVLRTEGKSPLSTASSPSRC